MDGGRSGSGLDSKKTVGASTNNPQAPGQLETGTEGHHQTSRDQNAHPYPSTSRQIHQDNMRFESSRTTGPLHVELQNNPFHYLPGYPNSSSQNQPHAANHYPQSGTRNQPPGSQTPPDPKPSAPAYPYTTSPHEQYRDGRQQPLYHYIYPMLPGTYPPPSSAFDQHGSPVPYPQHSPPPPVQAQAQASQSYPLNYGQQPYPYPSYYLSAPGHYPQNLPQYPHHPVVYPQASSWHPVQVPYPETLGQDTPPGRPQSDLQSSKWLSRSSPHLEQGDLKTNDKQDEIPPYRHSVSNEVPQQGDSGPAVEQGASSPPQVNITIRTTPERRVSCLTIFLVIVMHTLVCIGFVALALNSEKFLDFLEKNVAIGVSFGLGSLTATSVYLFGVMHPFKCSVYLGTIAANSVISGLAVLVLYCLPVKDLLERSLSAI